MFSYSADSFGMFGDLYHFPAGDHDPTKDKVQIYEWDTDRYMGEIPQVAHTYNVVGNMNEHGLAIGETTCGGRVEMADNEAILDYGSLIYLALQRCKTAREAIDEIVGLCNKYGYASSVESFTLADPDEIWILEFGSKGKKQPGDTTRIVYLASKIPDGHISGHANQIRQRKVIIGKPSECVYSEDVFTFAKSKGWTKAESIEEFDFTDAYAPVDAGSTRFCDARVWMFFRRVVGAKEMLLYKDYIYGTELNNPFPLSIDVKSKGLSVSLVDLQKAMHSQYQGTCLDMSQDLGAGPFGSPYRARPLQWRLEAGGTVYVNERPPGVPQTGWTMFAICRRAAKDAADGKGVGSLMWFSLGATPTAVQIPVFPTITRIPVELSRKHGSLITFSTKSLYWANALVAHQAMHFWSLVRPTIEEKMDELHTHFTHCLADAESTAVLLQERDEFLAREYLTGMVEEWAAFLLKEWQDFYGYMFQRYVDGFLHTPQPGSFIPKVTQVPLRKEWVDQIVKETGDRYRILDSATMSVFGGADPMSQMEVAMR